MNAMGAASERKKKKQFQVNSRNLALPTRNSKYLFVLVFFFLSINTHCSHVIGIQRKNDEQKKREKNGIFGENKFQRANNAKFIVKITSKTMDSIWILNYFLSVLESIIIFTEFSSLVCHRMPRKSYNVSNASLIEWSRIWNVLENRFGFFFFFVLVRISVTTAKSNQIQGYLNDLYKDNSYTCIVAQLLNNKAKTLFFSRETTISKNVE